MKTALAVILLALALSSTAHAILRPRFPHRTYPPAGGNSSIFLVDDSIRTTGSAIAPIRPR
jgi:hypothetical protein